jgi:ABC-type branched-subunit amino acid transport system ATPase component
MVWQPNKGGTIYTQAEFTNFIVRLEFKLPPGGIVGVIGPNGAGKTTLFKMITEREKPDAGSFKVGGFGLGTLGTTLVVTLGVASGSIGADSDSAGTLLARAA